MGLFDRIKEKNEKQGGLFLVVGLGNPGSKYENTRHNAGFMVLDRIAAENSISISAKKHKALIGRGEIAGRKVMLVKPQTFMNSSGDSVMEILDYYRLDARCDMVVIYDDISLKPGRIRIRERGSAGGHNGMKDIIAWTDTEDFARIRVGIGEKPPGWDLIDYVLGRFAPDERDLMDEAISDAARACEMIIGGNINTAMNTYN